MPQYYFPRPVAEEFTGHPHCTDLVIINKLLEEGRNTWEAWNAGSKPVQARLVTTTAFLPEIDRRAVLQAWAMAYDRSRPHADAAGRAAGLGVRPHQHARAGTRTPPTTTPPVRPSAGAGVRARAAVRQLRPSAGLGLAVP